MTPVLRLPDISDALDLCSKYPGSVPVSCQDSQGVFYVVGRRIPKVWGGLATLRVDGIMRYGSPELVFSGGGVG